MPEFDLIGRLRDLICLPPGSPSTGCELGIGDDAAVLGVPADRELVVCVDTLVEGVHFPANTAPAAIGHKALAVNLSDLAAMGAIPAWFLMALTLPAENQIWLDEFAGGMAELAGRSGINLVGGDTSSGPLSISITVLGLVEKGKAMTRSGACPGDLVAVSGTLGAAANALSVLRQKNSPCPDDQKALDFPLPRLGTGRALQGLATSCIDLSDGLVADLGHILEQSGVGASIELGRLPTPGSLNALGEESRWPLQLSGGDDYELCFTIPRGSENRLKEISLTTGVELTVIGTIHGRSGVELLTPQGELFRPDVTGYLHFGPQQGEKQ
jgi:thiamine-monophosphate kinase